jgi:hypothetical protein
MNERIGKLAEDAGMPTTLTYGQEQIFKRFAELIVREYSYDLMNLVAASPEHVQLAANHWGVKL